MSAAAQIAIPPDPRETTIAGHLVEIIREYMDLKPEQIVLYNQQWVIPKDSDLHLSVGLLAVRPFAAARSYEPTQEGMNEVITTNRQEMYEINVFAKGVPGRPNPAFLRNDEVVQALRSDLAERLMERHGFKIANLPASFVDSSEVDGEGILTRFTLSVAVLRAFSRSRPVEFFDQFTVPPRIVTQP